jgi:mono/diheme cytochrome c family protein
MYQDEPVGKQHEGGAERWCDALPDGAQGKAGRAGVRGSGGEITGANVGHAAIVHWQPHIRGTQVYERSRALTSHTRMTVPALAGIALVSCLLAASTPHGAAQTKKHTNKEAAGKAALIAQGKKIYVAKHCSICHAVSGVGGKTGPALPNPAVPPRTVKWLMDEVSNPKTHNPKSIMPASANMKGNDLRAIATYLASLKKK